MDHFVWMVINESANVFGEKYLAFDNQGSADKKLYELGCNGSHNWDTDVLYTYMCGDVFVRGIKIRVNS